MATKTSVFLNLALVLALLLAISAEGYRTFGVGFPKAQSPECQAVTGVNSGDTCSTIAETFGLTADFFDAINPNLNCDALFVGQWLCVAGTLN